MPGLLRALNQAEAEELGRERAKDGPAGEPRGPGSSLIAQVAREVQAHHCCCVPGAPSPGAFGEFALTSWLMG